MLTQDGFNAESATMTVEERPDGLRVTLFRPGTRRQRRLAFIFLFTLLTGLVVWVMMATGMLPEMSAWAQPLAAVRIVAQYPLRRLRITLSTLAVAALLEILLAAWMLRERGYREILHLGAGNWTVSRRPGSSARDLSVNPARVIEIHAMGGGRGLVARIGDRWLTLVRTGTPANREWLRDEMRRRIGFRDRPRDRRARYATWEQLPPPGYRITERGEGGALLTPSMEVRRQRFMPGLSWLGAHGYLLFKLFPKVLRGPLIGGPGRTFEFYLLVGLVGAVTVGLVGWVAYCLGGWTEWLVSRDQFHLRERLFFWTKVRGLLAPARWVVRPILGAKGQAQYRLDLESGDRKPVRILPAKKSEAEVAAVGRWLAERTGWPLEPGEPEAAVGKHGSRSGRGDRPSRPERRQNALGCSSRAISSTALTRRGPGR